MKYPLVLILFLLFITRHGYGWQGDSLINYYADERNAIGIPTDENVIIEGNLLFDNHCSSCHSLCQQRMGPALASVTDRRPVPWLLDFIHSSQSVIKKGDPYANFLYRKYNYAIMPDFRFLPDEKIMSILAFLHAASSAPTGVAGVNSQPLRDMKDPVMPEMMGAEATVQEAEDGGHDDVKERKYSILKAAFVAVAIGSVVAHLAYLGLLWRRGRTKFKM